MDFVYIFNGFEAVLWTFMACVAAFQAIKLRTRRSHLLLMAFTFVAFAGSELMEMKTGAWWRPIWLMLWKGACIGILVWQGIGHYRWWKRTRSDSAAAGAPSVVSEDADQDAQVQ